MGVSEKPRTGAEIHCYLQNVWEQEKNAVIEKPSALVDKDIVSTLDAMQKMFEFSHSKSKDMLKLGCTLPYLPSICLHRFTSAKFYPFSKSVKNFLSNVREDLVGGPSIVCTPKVVVDETHKRKSTMVYKIVVAIDTSRFCPDSM